MNWKEYFDLKEKKRKWFRIFFIILVLVNLWYFKSIVIEGNGYVCSKVNMTCENVRFEENDTKTGFLNQSIQVNNSDATLEDDSHAIIKNNPNIDSNRFEKYLNLAILNCNLDCEATSYQKMVLWYYRLWYTPLFILTDMAIAYMLSFLVQGFILFKMSRKKKATEGEAEKKEEKK